MDEMQDIIFLDDEEEEIFRKEYLDYIKRNEGDSKEKFMGFDDFELL